VYGLDPVARGHAVTAMVVAMIAAAFLYAPMDRWLGTRKWIVTFGTVLTILALAGIALFPRSGVLVSAALFAAVGGFGMTYGVLMAHGRAFLPDHLAARGVTLLNFLFIGGAGLIQPMSGLLVGWLRAKGDLDAAAIYGALHGVYALVLVLALAFYLAARDAPLPRRAT
jgi:MFS family permease